MERFCFGKVRCGVERDEIEEAIAPAVSKK